MDYLLYMVARGLLAVVQSLPLVWVARFGRGIGALAHRLDGRHRRMAIANLTKCLGDDKSPTEIAAIAKENFRRIGENFACSAKTASLTLDRMKERLEVVGLENVAPPGSEGQPLSRIFALGHLGNFEVFAHAVKWLPWCRGATTYRGLDSPGLNRLLLGMRQSQDVLFFERRRDGAALRAALRDQPLLLGLFCDQHAGDNGLRLPFFGRECSVSKAPAVFALRFNLPLHMALCYRTGLARWRIEVSPAIPNTHADGTPRTAAEMMLEVNRAFEAAIRRDPANWFWVHNRWKPASPRAMARAAAAAAEEEDGELAPGETTQAEATSVPRHGSTPT